MLGISLPTVEIGLDNAPVGQVRDLEAEQLPLLPNIILGCGLIDDPPAWKCAAAFWTTQIAVKEQFGQSAEVGAPAGYDRSLEVVPTLLGLERGGPTQQVGDQRYEQNASAYRACDMPGGRESTPASRRRKELRRLRRSSLEQASPSERKPLFGDLPAPGGSP